VRCTRARACVCVFCVCVCARVRCSAENFINMGRVFLNMPDTLRFFTLRLAVPSLAASQAEALAYALTGALPAVSHGLVNVPLAPVQEPPAAPAAPRRKGGEGVFAKPPRAQPAAAALEQRAMQAPRSKQGLRPQKPRTPLA
jgi:hypothetical protein